jgi:hypothetical protein
MRPPSDVGVGWGGGFGRPAGKKTPFPPATPRGGIGHSRTHPTNNSRAVLRYFHGPWGGELNMEKGATHNQARWGLGIEGSLENGPLIGQIFFCSPLWVPCFHGFSLHTFIFTQLSLPLTARVKIETQGKGNIGNKPGFFACFVSKKLQKCRPGRFWFLETKHMGFVRCFSHHSPGYFVSISFLRRPSQVRSAGTEKRQMANSFTGAPCI